MYIIANQSCLKNGITKGKRYKTIYMSPEFYMIINDRGDESCVYSFRFNQLSFKEYIQQLNKGD